MSKIPELDTFIEQKDGKATLLAPGPSSEIMPDKLHEGVCLSVNNIKPKYQFQWSADAIEMASAYPIYLETAENPLPTDSFFLIEQFESKTLDPLFNDGKVNHKLNNVAAACVNLIMHGATEIRLFGQDGCDPRGKNLSRWDVQDGKPRDDHYFDLIAANHARFEKVIAVAVRKHDVTFYNYSPFVDIDNTHRVFEKHGNVNAYKKKR